MGAPMPSAADPAVQTLEHSMLGAGLLDPGKAYAAAQAHGVTPQVFTDDANALIWGVIAALSGESKPADVISVYTMLADRGVADRCGGLEYLNALAQSVPSARNVDFYAAELAQRHRRRQDETTLLALARLAADPVLSAEQYAARKAELLADIANETRGATKREHFSTINVGALAETKPPPPVYHWQHYLPAGLLSVLAAHGGVGKTTIALMLAVHVVLGRPMFGVGVRRGTVVFYSGEDGRDLLSYRLAWICECMGVAPADLDGRLHILDATEADPVLFREVQADGRRVASITPAYAALRAFLDTVHADVLVVDNMSDTYDGNEIARAPVRAYLRALGQLAKPARAVLLLAHVDKATARGDRASNTDAYSGSTATNNSARSRMAMFRDKDGGIVLEHQKHNLGRMREPLHLQWLDGQLPAAVAPVGAQMQFITDLAHIKALLQLLHEFYERGEYVSTSKNSPTSVRALLAKQPGYPTGRSASEVADLLRTAQRQGYIEAETYKTRDRKERERWALTRAGHDLIGVLAPSAPSAPTHDFSEAGAAGAGSAPSAPTPGARGVGGHGAHRPGAVGGVA
jgi:putative DNA primase/helicase